MAIKPSPFVRERSHGFLCPIWPLPSHRGARTSLHLILSIKQDLIALFYPVGGNGCSCSAGSKLCACRLARRLQLKQPPQEHVTGRPPFRPPLGLTRNAALRLARSERSTWSGIVAGSMLSVHGFFTPRSTQRIGPRSHNPSTPASSRAALSESAVTPASISWSVLRLPATSVAYR